MDKSQAINNFWNSFGVPAYDENSVPQDATYPRITYNVATGSLEDIINMTASLWYRSSSWKDIALKSTEIEYTLGIHGGVVLPLDEGKLWIAKGVPFSQRMSDPDDSIRRIVLNVQAEYLTPF